MTAGVRNVLIASTGNSARLSRSLRRGEAPASIGRLDDGEAALG